MAAERLSYREFKEEFVIAVAHLVRADTDKQVDLAEIGEQIDGTFRQSWLATAESELREQGLIDGPLYIGSSKIQLTGLGLDKAEEWASERGYDLYDFLDATGGMEDNLPGADEIDRSADSLHSDLIVVNPLSATFKEVNEQLTLTIDELRGRNELMVQGGAEASQRLAELEAGSRLLKAEQADASLLKRVLLPALTWFGKKVGDEAAKQLIVKLIAAVGAFLGGVSGTE